MAVLMVGIVRSTFAYSPNLPWTKKMLLFLSLKLGDLSVPLIDRHARTNRFGFKFGVFVGFEEENEEDGGGGEREVEDEAGGQQVRG